MSRTVYRRTVAILIAAIIFTFLLFSCRKNEPSVTSGNPTETIGNSFSCTANISYNGIDAVATINKKGGSLFTVELESPKVLRGMTFDYTGEDMTVSYLGMKFTLNDDSILATGISNALVNVFNGAANDSGLSVGKKGDYYVVAGESDSGNYKLYLDKKTGKPVKLEIPSLNFSSDFSQFKVEK